MCCENRDNRELMQILPVYSMVFYLPYHKAAIHCLLFYTFWFNVLPEFPLFSKNIFKITFLATSPTVCEVRN